MPAYEFKYAAAAVSPGKARVATCPICDKPASTDAGNKWRPFCSQRCKLADLGQWFAERYTIPADPEPDEPVEPPESPEQLSRQ